MRSFNIEYAFFLRVVIIYQSIDPRGLFTKPDPLPVRQVIYLVMAPMQVVGQKSHFLIKLFLGVETYYASKKGSSTSIFA